MFKNKLLFLLMCSGFLGFTQVKKETDTIYIYEEVIVYDTIYIEKPLARLQLEKVIVSPIKRGIKPFLTVIQNNKKIVIPIDSLIIESRRKSFANNWQFGAKIITGFNSNSLFEEFGTQVQMSYGLGLFIKKTLLHPDFSMGIGIDTSLLKSSLNSNASNSESFLNGFYFTENGSPKLFEGFNNKGFQIQIPVQFYWKIKKFTPSIGIFGNLTNYESTFIESSGNLPLILDSKQKFDARTFYFGYLFQLEYTIYKKWSVGISYSYSQAKKLIFKISNETFAVDKKINQSTFGMNIIYEF